MQYFTERNGELYAEDLPLRDVAERFGTPCYVYSRAAFTQQYLSYAQALGSHPGMICYAIKANSNLAILNMLAKLGAGFDIVSGGELERVLYAGGNPSRIVFSGVGKSVQEMARALDVGIFCFNVESEAELELLAQVAADKGKVANVSLRVNPDVDANTHPYISTGLKENKFGIAIERAPAVYARAAQLPSLAIKGLDCHIGSQLTQLTPFLDALERLLLLIDELAAKGIHISHLDLGGGLGVTYRDETPPPVAEYMAAIKAKLGDRPLALMFEPGRSISANAGVLLTQVMFLKPTEHKNFAVIDAAMNDNIRPSLYQAWQDIRPLQQRGQAPKTWDLVGPICETGDFLGKGRELAIEPGDLLAVMSAGAYGFSMSSNYNTRGRAAEVVVDGDQMHLVRARETFEDLIRGEALLPE
ncbi:diaminopimelate decarboxylase [Cellvibrio japonicus]|uniref:Diaminopimelate decarboxylase n=1 Tax=Cellvibrio japonicus (strain Ueda107) TaxID=498211 RepID=B3PEI9_CELJU|nr:diaminopimelate decarboxylase [Cellvibrio japonicus]ACE84391.1 diaminopimelate decarboxylase [Cellvibrio japonicus Ueda107]QEI14294.1 diaminopimelate decarboxylase [Cellvibrio japonicus]QEI17871.1 diaminopimelate decarboxylase [Cellvibrio japonicus]QEI21447.1 diaminopimelate decarboxylase [Cellvibrio japonicus]